MVDKLSSAGLQSTHKNKSGPHVATLSLAGPAVSCWQVRSETTGDMEGVYSRKLMS